MPNPRLVLFALCLATGVCAFGAAWMWNNRPTASPAPSQEDQIARTLDLRISDFELIDQDSNPIDATILDGVYTVAGFIFTNCPGLCPIMTTTMAEAQDRLSDTPVRFLSLSLDAERDSPQAMKDFAARHNARLNNWAFATGDTAQARRIVAEDLMLVVQDEDENQVPTTDGSTMANILHPTRMILIGPDRRVLGFYTVSNISGVEALEADVRELLEG
ncbi:MAG: SCO family protein [Planctomycetota bacterium]